MQETLTIIYRATDHRFGVHAKDRFFSKSKTEISKTCFNSLYKSFQKYQDRVKFIIVGDRLSPGLQSFFKKFNDVKLYEYEGGDKTGLRDNILTTLNIAYEQNTDWIWVQEDDYLFVDDTADRFFELIDNKEKILKSTQKNIVIYPADYSDRYTRHKDGNKKYQLFLSNLGYWREIHNTTFSWCLTKNRLVSLKHLFDQMLDEIKFKTFDTFLSDKIWNDNMLIISPLPSLSAHLDSHISLPPCVDWKKVWNDNVSL